jgi:predicted aspartyl protease
VKFETAFDVTQNLIFVEGSISGPLGETHLRLVLDTGSAECLIVPEVADSLGYNTRDAEILTGVYSAVGKEHGYMRRVLRFAALGFDFPDFRIHVFHLPDRYGIDGLIGLSFLRQFNLEIRPLDGLIHLEKITG